MRLASYLDSEQSKKASHLVIKKGRLLGCLLYLVGVVFLVLLPSTHLNRKNYFDENALMAGLVKREFRDQESIMRYAASLKPVALNEQRYLSQVEAELAVLGMEVYSQNFSAVTPLSLNSKDAVVSGRNVYGILRAGRAHSTESIILSAPYLSTPGKDNVHGAAVMLALAKYFKAKNYWAKDLIFLVTSHDGIGMQAWVDQYMGLRESGATGKFGISSTNLPGRSGAIQAVLNLEIPSSHIDYVNIVVEGVNGILPNLDLVNVAVYLCHSEKVSVAFQSRWEWLGSSPFLDAEHQRALYTVAAMALRQGPGLPLGGHAHFLQHRIDSVTLRAVGGTQSSSSHGSRDLVNVARALEGSFRSVNNLLETLHHSEFFYFNAATWRFVSIGLYMPALAFLIAPVVMEALSQWLQARNPHLSLRAEASEGPSSSSTPPFPFHTVLQLLLGCYGSGLLLGAVMLGLAHVLYPLDIHTFALAVQVPGALTVLTPLLIRCRLSSNEWRMAKSLSLIMFLLTLLTLSMLNFSLAVGVSFVFTLPSVLAQPLLLNRGWIQHLPRLLLVGLFCPPLCLVVLSGVTLYLFPSTPLLSWAALWDAAYSNAIGGVASAMNSWHFHSCWLYPVTCLGVWPLWMMAWTLVASFRESGMPHPPAPPTKLHSD